MRRHQHITELGSLLEATGIRHVIICPGSRNAPLIQLFTVNKAFHCHSIVDERSAGYVALGMARQLKEAVVVLTTSGTAVLNLAPAVAEAYQQEIPLLVITADRPPEKINQFNNQRLDQREAFRFFSRGFYQCPLPVEHPEDLSKMRDEVLSLLSEAILVPTGPVHMNIILDEPLYESLPPALEGVKYQLHKAGENEITVLGPMAGEKKIMILAGMGKHSKRVSDILLRLSESDQVVVIAENIANLPEAAFISQADLLLAGVDEEGRRALLPNVVLAFGGQVVSKRLKLLLQSIPNLEHYEIEGQIAASLESLSESLPVVAELSSPLHFREAWKREEQRAVESSQAKLESLPYSMLSSIHLVLDLAPEGSYIHLGNSSTIRYSQNLPIREDLTYYSNRGTSGIDGCVSAAVGAAMVSDLGHVLLLGDLSFVYDSNAMWNRDFPENLKIVVLNDRGGGIFRLLKGPSEMAFFEEFSVSHHPVSPKKLALSYGRTARLVENKEELEEALTVLFDPESKLAVLEVDLSGSENSRIFREFLDQKD